MTTTTNIEAVNSGQTEREAFKEFRAALCRMNGAITPVSVADRVMILSNATFLLDEYERAASPAPASPSGEPGMTNGDFHCPACGSVMKGPTSCGSCLWERDTCGYAVAASPSGEDAAEQADEVVTDADMFWPEHDGEQIYHSLDDAVTAVFEDSGAAAGDTFTFTCAARLPKVTVRIIEVTENGFEWEEIAARAKDSK